MSEAELPRKEEGSEAVVPEEPATEARVEASAPAPVVKVKKTGFLPVALGGVMAAGVGYGAAFMGYGTEFSPISARMDALEASTVSAQAELEGRLAALPAAPDLSPVTAKITALEESLTTVQAEVAGAVQPLAHHIDALGTRIAALELAPSGDGTLSEAALEAWQAQLDGLRAEFVAQQEKVAALASEAEAGLAAARETLAGLEAEAIAAAQSDLAAASVERIGAALASGEAFGASLLNLQDQGLVPPAALADLASSGAATLTSLQESFPAAAREALAAERASSPIGGFANFLRSQLNVRSVTPREGEDADAVLSRAQAAVAGGDLRAAVTLIEALPVAAKDAMSQWLAQAQRRLQAETALEALRSDIAPVVTEGAAE